MNYQQHEHSQPDYGTPGRPGKRKTISPNTDPGVQSILRGAADFDSRRKYNRRKGVTGFIGGVASIGGAMTSVDGSGIFYPNHYVPFFDSFPNGSQPVEIGTGIALGIIGLAVIAFGRRRVR